MGFHNVSSKVRVLSLVVIAVLSSSAVVAEDVEKKFRIGVALGGFNAQDEVESDAANDLVVIDQAFQPVELYSDPRDDSAAFGNLEIQPGPIATVQAQYAVDKIFIIEASIGYQKTDVGDVEVSAQFDGIDIPDLESFVFSTFRVPVGELERVPLQVTGLARFRPRASFNPYFGGGIGYTFIGFDTDPAFDDLSRNMDASRGGQQRLSGSLFSNPTLSPPAVERNLVGARIDARDTWEWHVVGGAELSVKRNWALVFDVRWTFSSRAMEVGFNDGLDLGIAVPSFTDFAIPGSIPPAPDLDRNGVADIFGSVRISSGGLIDGGSLVPDPDAPPSADCAVDPRDCTFIVGAFDGQVDPGSYYVQGGRFEYGGFSAQIGFRYTF